MMTHYNDIHLENEAHRLGDNRSEDPYRFWWECPIHGEIADEDVEFDGDGDAVCPVQTGESVDRTRLICGKPLDYHEDDGIDDAMNVGGEWDD